MLTAQRFTTKETKSSLVGHFAFLQRVLKLKTVPKSDCVPAEKVDVETFCVLNVQSVKWLALNGFFILY